MKLAALILGTVTAVAVAQTPTILATLPNQGGGKITFTSERSANCKPDQLLAYAQNKGGKVELTGCYRLIGEEVFVVWSDGDVYTYPFDSLQISKEMERYSGKQL
jgi:hypothetical protein